MSDLCIACGKVAGKRQHGVTCDVCDRWQHRICGTGIDREQYFSALRGGDELKFVCEPCTSCIPPRSNDGIEIGTDATAIVAEYLLEEAAENDEYATAAIEDNEATFQISLPSTSSDATVSFDLGSVSGDVSDATARDGIDSDEDSGSSSDEDGSQADDSERNISGIPDVSIRVESSFQEPQEV